MIDKPSAAPLCTALIIELLQALNTATKGRHAKKLEEVANRRSCRSLRTELLKYCLEWFLDHVSQTQLLPPHQPLKLGLDAENKKDEGELLQLLKSPLNLLQPPNLKRVASEEVISSFLKKKESPKETFEKYLTGQEESLALFTNSEKGKGFVQTLASESTLANERVSALAAILAYISDNKEKLEKAEFIKKEKERVAKKAKELLEAEDAIKTTITAMPINNELLYTLYSAEYAIKRQLVRSQSNFHQHADKAKERGDTDAILKKMREDPKITQSLRADALLQAISCRSIIKTNLEVDAMLPMFTDKNDEGAGLKSFIKELIVIVTDPALKAKLSDFMLVVEEYIADINKRKTMVVAITFLKGFKIDPPVEMAPTPLLMLPSMPPILSFEPKRYSLKEKDIDHAIAKIFAESRFINSDNLVTLSINGSILYYILLKTLLKTGIKDISPELNEYLLKAFIEPDAMATNKPILCIIDRLSTRLVFLATGAAKTGLIKELYSLTKSSAVIYYMTEIERHLCAYMNYNEYKSEVSFDLLAHKKQIKEFLNKIENLYLSLSLNAGRDRARYIKILNDLSKVQLS